MNFSSDGNFNYLPNAGFVGNDNFSFGVSDGLNSDSETFTINVYNTAPVASNGSDSVLHDQSMYSMVYGYDMDGDPLTFSISSGPSNGGLTFHVDGSFDYTPNAGFVGADSFVFQAGDGIATATATFTIDVHNNAPIAYDHQETVLHDRQLTANVAGNDLDSGTVTFRVVTGPTNGTLNLNSDGSYDYTPSLLNVGLDSFDFEISDAITTATGTISINVYNTDPVAIADCFDVELNNLITGSVMGNDSDADGDILTVSLVSGPTHARNFTLNPDGSFEYDPERGYIGSDQFVYELTDGLGTSLATVFLTVDGNHNIDIKVAAFTPLSKGVTVSWDAPPGQPYETLHWAPEPVQWGSGAVQ